MSLAPTHVNPLVRWLVGHTFEFPLPMNISVQQLSLMTPPILFLADMFLHMVAGMVADMGAGMVADKVAGMVADMAAEKKVLG